MLPVRERAVVTNAAASELTYPCITGESLAAFSKIAHQIIIHDKTV